MAGGSIVLATSSQHHSLLEQNAFDRVAAIGFTRLRSVEEKRKRSHLSVGGVTGDVFSNPQILQAVHKFHLYKDSKDFVDSPLQASPAEVLSYFWNHVDTDDVESVKSFLATFWSEPGSELLPSDPSDWQEEPDAISQIGNAAFRSWGLELNKLWKDLFRKMKPEVQAYPDRYSLVHVPHSFIIPGGRFREFYYWDSYWVIKGLLVSGMFETAKDMIRNFVYMVERFGFIPNGGRTYLMNRSQPPFLIPMVYDYYKATKDEQFLRDTLPFLHAENDWWWKNRSVNMTMESGKSYTLFQYRASIKSPRPESFKEDIHSAASLSTEAEKEAFYQSVASACESGWDFSSRWFADGVSLSSCVTTKIVPVDLNAMMCLNAQILSEIHSIVGNEGASMALKEKWQAMVHDFNEVFWNDEAGCWFDYSLSNNSHNSKFYGSCIVPIFANAYDDVSKAERAFQYAQKSGALSCGLATSLSHSGEQWDFPNAWAPLVHMLIVGLRNSANSALELAAEAIATKWLTLNHKLFVETGNMYEKYNVSSESQIAGGGEYEIQTGFGWTNGVVLDLLSIYGCDEVEELKDQATKLF